MEKQNIPKDSHSKTPAGLDDVVQGSTPENGLVCSHCWAPFANVNEIYKCPKHPEILTHDGDCGHCTELGCKMPTVSYLGERSRENVEQRVSALSEKRQVPVERYRSSRQSDAPEQTYSQSRRGMQMPLKILMGVYATVMLGVFPYMFIIQPRKELYERHFHSMQGQVLHEEYKLSDRNTEEYYCIQMQGKDGQKYTIRILPTSRVSLRELEEKVRIGSMISFPLGNITKEGIENLDETIFFQNAVNSEHPFHFPVDKTEGFKPADRITVIDEKK